MKNWISCLLTALIVSAASCLAWAQDTLEQRPANFIFLVDVSGSMLFKKNMVKAADGSSITLFEALREALKHIVSDPRLISPQSKVAFITFGSAITEKSDWPTSFETQTKRQELLDKLGSPQELQSDPHGDTYMGGALDKGYSQALAFAKGSEPCTTTFIVMLTDGWDEPPHGATVKVRDVAARIVQKQQELKRKLGVNTWQVKVIGLQQLPDSKAGTTTAKQVAQLLGGEFLDVTKQSSGTVEEQIFAAMKRTISDLSGKVEVAPVSKGGIADFGTMQGAVKIPAQVQVMSNSCYGEKITSVSDVSKRLTEVQKASLRQELGNLPNSSGQTAFASSLPPSALDIRLEKEVLLIPTIDQVSKGTASWQPMTVVATVGGRCPPGAYIGALEIQSTAKCEKLVPFRIAVPSRVVADTESIKTTIRKPGFLFTKPTDTKLEFQVGTSLAGQAMSPRDLSIEPQDAKEPSGKFFNKSLINNGRPHVVHLNLTEQGNQKVSLAVNIPAEQEPGTYTGRLNMRMTDTTNLVAPPDIEYVIDILPSPWEQVKPIAIPILILLIAAIVVYIGIWFATSRSS